MVNDRVVFLPAICNTLAERMRDIFIAYREKEKKKKDYQFHDKQGLSLRNFNGYYTVANTDTGGSSSTRAQPTEGMHATMRHLSTSEADGWQRARWIATGPFRNFSSQLLPLCIGTIDSRSAFTTFIPGWFDFCEFPKNSKGFCVSKFIRFEEIFRYSLRDGISAGSKIATKFFRSKNRMATGTSGLSNVISSSKSNDTGHYVLRDNTGIIDYMKLKAEKGVK